MKKIILLLVVLLCFAVCTKKPSESSADTKTQDSKLKIVATIFPPYDFTRAVAKDRADISMLVKPGTEIHSYDPSPSDIIRVQESDIFIYIGGESDVWVDTVLASMDTSSKKILRLMDYVNVVEEEIVEGMQEENHEHESEDHEHEGEDHEHEEGEMDEHIWTSPKNAIILTNVIAGVLAEKDAKNADFYRENAASYTTELEQLYKDFASVAANAKRKKIIVADRFPFRYLADELSISYSAAFPGCSTETDVSAATMAYLINEVKSGGYPYIYYIELSSQKVASTLAEETGAKPIILHSAHNLTDSDFRNGLTYVSIMRQNVENLKLGLE